MREEGDNRRLTGGITTRFARRKFGSPNNHGDMVICDALKLSFRKNWAICKKSSQHLYPISSVSLTHCLSRKSAQVLCASPVFMSLCPFLSLTISFSSSCSLSSLSRLHPPPALLSLRGAHHTHTHTHSTHTHSTHTAQHTAQHSTHTHSTHTAHKHITVHTQYTQSTAHSTAHHTHTHSTNIQHKHSTAGLGRAGL